MASVPSMAIWDFESLRSKRVLTSFIACWMALATSARSILLTISKLLSGMEYQSILRLVMLRDAAQALTDFWMARPKHVHLRVTEEGLSAKAGAVSES